MRRHFPGHAIPETTEYIALAIQLRPGSVAVCAIDIVLSSKSWDSTSAWSLFQILFAQDWASMVTPGKQGRKKRTQESHTESDTKELFGDHNFA